MARSIGANGLNNRKSERQMARGTQKSYRSNTAGNTVQRIMNGRPPGSRMRLAGTVQQQR